jgi:holo-[acyl-carrier protein] synthase
MIIGIGIDIIEIERIKKVYMNQPKFPRKILCEKEYTNFLQLEGRRQIEFLAGRFAAKEAYSKACGTGIGKCLGWHDIKISSEKSGRPVIQTKFKHTAFLSISHSKEYVVANVIIQSSSS